jgi:hypothetical protein
MSRSEVDPLAKEATVATFHHFGVPTKIKQAREQYLEGAKIYVTDPDKHPYKVEFLRFEAESPLPKAVRTQPHAAFVVDDLPKALRGEKVIIEPFDATDTIRVAFIAQGDAVIELMQMK